MAENETGKETVVENKVLNTKTEKMEQFLKDNKIAIFNVEKVDDEVKTTIFRSRMEVKGQILPFAILIDNTIYTLLQVQVAPAVAKDEAAFLKLAPFINELNVRYRNFKFDVSTDGALLLNMMLSAKDTDFDPVLVNAVLAEIVKFLNNEYPNIMKKIWE